jgi:hypothetical protein
MKVLVEFDLERYADKILFEYVCKVKQQNGFVVDKKSLIKTSKDARDALSSLSESLNEKIPKLNKTERAKLAAKARWDKKKLEDNPSLAIEDISSFEDEPTYPDGREIIEGTWNRHERREKE